MTGGRVVAVCVGEGGIPKHPQPAVELHPQGVAGDRHRHPRFHGGVHKAVCLFSVEGYRTLHLHGLPLHSPGAVGENVTLSGIELDSLRPGDRLLLGEAEIQVSEPRIPCHTLDSLSPRIKLLLDLKTPGPGWYARVLIPGRVSPGDPAVVLSGNSPSSVTGCGR